MMQLTDHHEYSEARDALEAAQEARARALDEVNTAKARVDEARRAKANDADEVDALLAERAASAQAFEAAQARLEFADDLQSEKTSAAASAKLVARRMVLADAQERYDAVMDSIGEGIETILDAVDQAAELRRASEHAMDFGSAEQRKARFKLDRLEPHGRALEELRRWAGLPLPDARKLGRGAPGRSRHEHAGTVQATSA